MKNICAKISITFSFYLIFIAHNVFVNSYSPNYANAKSKWNSAKIKSTLPIGVGKILSELDIHLSYCGIGKIDIRELTIIKTQKYFASGQLTSEELTECYLKRIRAMNPYLKAIIEINPDALMIARTADAERKNSGYKNLLHGIPILIKDNLATLDKMQTTAGAIAMEWILPTSDSDVVKKLRASGAVILGKTNPSEWSYFRGTDPPNGWSGRGGQTLNPYNLTADPEGSSSGSGAGTATNFGLISIGTDTGGSIVAPSSVESLVGLRPTVGCVSTKGVIPIAFTQDTVGPMTRTARDAHILFNAIAHQKCKVKSDVSKDETKLKIGVLRDPFWNGSDSLLQKIIPKLEIALTHLENSGQAVVIDAIKGNSNMLKTITRENERIVFNHEFKYSINKLLQDDVVHLEVKHGRHKMSQLADIVEFNIQNPPPEGYNQEHLIKAQATDGLQNQTYIKQRRINLNSARKYLDQLFDGGNKIDLIAAPCYSDNTKLLFQISSIAAYPNITVPAGIGEDGVPIGLCFAGRANDEATLFRIAYLLEKVYFQRTTPKFRAH